MKNKAFTLIELLIVVAIIAILAAIAVPNFLEAQTRSKVSRVKADMRSYATAIEAYFVDYNHYPNPEYSATFDPVHRQWYGGLQLLTTPVAFMTSILQDPFLTVEQANVNGANLYLSYKYYMWDFTAYDIVWGSAAFTTFPWANPSNPTEYVKSPFYTTECRWLMSSLGPDKRAETALPRVPFVSEAEGQTNGLSYDPTNGTISKGDIYRFGPGGNPKGYSL